MTDERSSIGCFDYIVVGAGSAGAVVASRLSEDPRTRVLLLEAGPSHRRLWTQIPLGYAKTFFDSTVNWGYHSAPVAALNNRCLYVPRGKVLGGSSAINAMVYARGRPEDFDDWEALGNPGWGWRDVLPIYRKMEHHALGADAWHGAGGPVRVSDVAGQAHPLCGVFFAAAAAAGYDFNPDLNGATSDGVGHYQITAARGRRVSSASAYLDPAARRANLAVLTGAEADTILFDGHRAAGVAFTQRGQARRAECRGEVIVSAGAINSPKLLMLSGIGPAGPLAERGVPVRVDAPAVGANLQDHASFDVFYRATVPTLNSELAGLRGRFKAGLRYVVLRRGILALSLNQAGGFITTRPGSARPNLQLYFCPLAYDKPAVGGMRVIKVDATPRFSLTGSLCYPRSRGRIELASADPQVAPVIRLDLLANAADLDEAVEAFHAIRELGQQQPLAAVGREDRPGSAVQGRAEVEAYLRANIYSIFHPCGTCAMGPDPRLSVVDPKLRVYGASGLRVIDASVFPLIPSGNINAPAMMVGEKGAALLRER